MDRRRGGAERREEEGKRSWGGREKERMGGEEVEWTKRGWG